MFKLFHHPSDTVAKALLLPTNHVALDHWSFQLHTFGALKLTQKVQRTKVIIQPSLQSWKGSRCEVTAHPERSRGQRWEWGAKQGLGSSLAETFEHV